MYNAKKKLNEEFRIRRKYNIKSKNRLNGDEKNV